MGLYTRTGDQGETSLFGGERVKKSAPRIAVYGVLDELSSQIGVCRSICENDYALNALLKEIQHDLYLIGGHIAGSEEKMKEGRVEYLEKMIDKFNSELEPLNSFILPTGIPLAAQLHIARTVCRRSERKLCSVYEHETSFPEELKYINRLSDLLFTLARYANKNAGRKDELAY